MKAPSLLIGSLAVCVGAWGVACSEGDPGPSAGGSAGAPIAGSSAGSVQGGSTAAGGTPSTGGASVPGGGSVGTSGATTGGAGGLSGGAGVGGNVSGGSASGGASGGGGASSGGVSGSGGLGGGAGAGASSTGGIAGGGVSGGAGTGGAPSTCTQPIANAQSWDDIKAAHKVPEWLKKAKLGIQIHWGLYAVPAYHNEWFFQHLYCNKSFADWTAKNFPTKSPLSNGPWGYKDFISGFTAKNWDPSAWAAVFKKSGATWVQLSAQHHDRFALWDSALTKWDAKDMGPKRDLVGDLATAVRAQGLKFGVSNHIMYGNSFAYCGPNGTAPGNVGPKTPANIADLYDPAYADFYGPPESNCGSLSTSQACSPSQSFCDDWLARSKELAEKYQLDLQWFDWDGANVEGSVCWNNKRTFVRDYYKAACSWGKEVATAGKAGVFPGSDTGADGANIMIHDFETGGHAPAAGQEPDAFWMVDDKIGSASWGYIDGMTYRSAASIISQMDNYNRRGGVLVLNVSPMADGTLPKAQQDILIELGKHLGVAP